MRWLKRLMTIGRERHVQDQPRPIERFDWERLILRADIPKHLKALALAMAVHGNKDGSRVRPGRRLLADIFDDSERTVEIGIKALLDQGLLIQTKRGGGRAGEGKANVYQLSDPGPDRLPMRLDPDGNRLTQKAVKPRPGRRIDPKRTSGEGETETAPGADIDPKPASVENDFHPKPTTDSPEVHYALTRSALRPTTSDHTKTNTPLVVPVGDQLTSRAPDGPSNPNGISGVELTRSPPSPEEFKAIYRAARVVVDGISKADRDAALSVGAERAAALGLQGARWQTVHAAQYIDELNHMAWNTDYREEAS